MNESNCKYCNEKIKRYGSPGIFCSRACKADFEKSSWDIKKSISLYESGKSLNEVSLIFQVSRETIKKEFVNRGVDIRNKTDWLNTDKNPTKGKPRSEEVKRKLSVAATKQFSNPEAREFLSKKMTERILSGKIKRVSKLEDLVAKELDELGVSYERQKIFRNERGQFIALVDFYFNDMLVEINGTFWHSDLRKYPNGPEYQIQKSAYDKHSRKLEYLNSQGHKVYEIWEIDIKENVRKVLLQLLKNGESNDS